MSASHDALLTTLDPAQMEGIAGGDFPSLKQPIWWWVAQLVLAESRAFVEAVRDGFNST